MTWVNPGGHNAEECYFCINFVSVTNSPKKGAVKYVATISRVLPVKHHKQSPPLCLAGAQQADTVQQDATNEEDMDIDIDLASEIDQPSTPSEYVPPRSINTNPTLVTQQYLNHMVRKLELSRKKSATSASLLKNNNLLDRQAEFIPRSTNGMFPVI